MGAIRAAIWAAVSTETQAGDDKVSLPAQQELCRALVASRGWEETAGPYVVAGASRTRWVNLRDAEQAIPELRVMLDDAQAGRFNLLVLYDYNRLRDLLDPVARTLAAYGCQILSVSQPVEPLAPTDFDPYASDSSSMMQGLSQIVSRAQVADLRRKYRVAMPKRVKELGLPAIGIPYGYAKPPGRETDPKAVPALVPEEAQVVRMIGDLFEIGHSRASIARILTAMGILSPAGYPQWGPGTINYILKNPFYCGKVAFGRSRVKPDPRTGGRKRLQGIPPSLWTVGQGKHEPIWTEEQFEAIQQETHRRLRRRTAFFQRTYQLSSLLHCVECDSIMARFRVGRRRETAWSVWRCYRGSSHLRAMIPERAALSQLAAMLQELLLGLDLPGPTSRQEPRANVLATHQDLLDGLEARRVRFQRAYGDGLMSYEDFAARIREVDEQARALATLDVEERQRELTTTKQRSAAERLAAIVGGLPAFLAEAPPHEVNQALRDLLESVVVGRGQILELRLRLAVSGTSEE